MSKILLVSPSSSERPSFEYGVKVALEKLNNQVSVFNYRFSYLHKLAISNLVLNKFILKKALNDNPDIVLVLKGEKLEKGIIEKISDAGIKTANYIMDDPLGIYGNTKLENIQEYDNFFVFDPFYVKKIKETGYKNAYYLPCATNPELYTEQITLKKREYRQDFSFIGTYHKNREEVLSELSQEDMKIWGYNWNKSELLKNNFQNEPLHGTKNINHTKKICRIFNETKINMNVHFTHSRESVNIRTFDIPATKSFMLTDYFKEIPNLFRKNEIATYKDKDELTEKVDYYLDNEEERHKISLAGYKRVIKEHTIYHRMKELLSIVS